MIIRLRAHPAIVLAGIVTICACGPGSDTPAESRAVAPLSGPRPVTGAVFPLPEPDLPADDGTVQLGRQLFNDARLSANGEISCASCHDVANGGDDGRRYSIGVTGEPTERNTPTVLNSSLNFAQSWDGRARTVEEQISIALTGEMISSPELAAAALEGDVDVVARFRQSYGTGLTPDNLVDALATYVRALTTPGAPFDRYLEGDRSAIDAQAREGFELFQDLGCVSCHQGRNIGGNLFQHFGVMDDYFADRGDVTEADLGRYNVTGREQDKFKFKVPSLRNVAETAPYFHDGSAATLEEAVRAMLEYQLGRPADDAKIARIVAFLETLSAPVDESLQ